MSEDFPTNAKFNVEKYYPQTKINAISSKFTVIPNNFNHHNQLLNSTNIKDVLNVTSETKQECGKCQSAESEVSFLKEWLLLHLDLIQQQNEEITSKERTILILQQENEMLKERLVLFKNELRIDAPKSVSPVWKQQGELNVDQDIMTQDLRTVEEDTRNNSNASFCFGEISKHCATKVEPVSNVDSECITDNCNKTQEHKDINVLPDDYLVYNLNETVLSDVKSEPRSEPKSDISNDLNSRIKYHFSVETSEQDIMHNLRMNIKRRRMCSNSSALSHNSKSSLVEENMKYSKFKKKRKRNLKDTQIYTTSEPYFNYVGDSKKIPKCDTKPIETKSEKTVLEVPRWRIKVYSSLYTMEGTENLTDESFLKRHQRLEIDEKRRKKWDAQRIREQRHIEKLRQRQDKINNINAKNDNNSEEIESFWPSTDDVKFIEVCDELPISAFGCPIPKLPPSEFKLPWLNMEEENMKKSSSKGKGRRRKKSKRF